MKHMRPAFAAALFLLLLASAAGAQAWLPGASARPGETIRASSEPVAGGVRVACTFPGFLTEAKTTPAGSFTAIRDAGMGIEGEVGRPELPVWRRLLEVPEDAINVRLANVSAATGMTRTLPDGPLAPAPYPRVKLPHPATGAKGDAYDAQAYQEDRWLADAAVAIEEAGTMRSRRLFQVVVYPLAHNPAQATVRVRSKIVFEVLWDAPKTLDAAGTERRHADFDAVVDGFLLNPPVGPKALNGDPPTPEGYLIIGPDRFVEDPALVAFAEWKSQLGFDTTLVSTAQTGTANSSIRTYIRGVVDTWENPPVYVLLVGDTADIPHFVSNQTGGPATDLPYSALDDAEWQTPDVFVGRWPVTSIAELEAAAVKTISYEQGSDAASGWMAKAAFMAGNDEYTLTEGTHNHIADSFFAPAGITSDKNYEQSYGAVTADVTQSLSEGRTWAIFSGHGSSDSWADGPQFKQTNVRNLPGTAPPIVFSFACITGKYALSECFGETWIRAAGGGATFYGSAANSYWAEDDVYQRALFNGLYAGHTRLGAMLAYGDQALVVEYGLSGYRTHLYHDMYNLMGDPSINLRTAPPSSLETVFPETVIAGMPSVSIPNVPSGALLCATQDGTILAMARGTGGPLELAFAEPPTTGEVRLTCSKHNALPVWADVPVAAPSAGQLALDADRYACPGMMTIRLTDAGLAGAPQAEAEAATGIDAVAVVLAATATPGLFEASLPLACGVAIAEDGILQGDSADTITVTYADDDDGTGHPIEVTVQAELDGAGPAIGDVAFGPVEATQATVHFTTSESAQTGAYAGAGIEGPFTKQASSTGFTTSHELLLTGLEPAAIYFVQIEAEDQVGNLAQLPEPLALVTPEAPDYCTENFEFGANDLAYQSVTFHPVDAGASYLSTCSAATQLPHALDEATVLDLGDDDSFHWALAGGASVPLYGVDYADLYIGSNGYITLGESDTTFGESLGAHFDKPRVAALFDDLNPAQGGTVYYEQTAEAAVVTYVDVVEYGISNGNTFQAELFFDGRIRLTWLKLTATDGLAGLSSGGGVPVDFVMSDLTAGSAAPPAVSASRRTSNANTNRAAVEFVVSFSRGVEGVDAGDFVFAEGAPQDAAITQVVPVGASIYRVAVQTGTGDGYLKLDVVDDDSIVDGLAAPLGGPGAENGNFDSGEAYHVDRTAPEIADAVQHGPTGIEVTFTEAMSDDVLDPSLYSLVGDALGGFAAQPARVIRVDEATLRLEWDDLLPVGDLMLSISGGTDLMQNGLAPGTGISLTTFAMPVADGVLFVLLFAAVVGIPLRRLAQ